MLINTSSDLEHYKGRFYKFKNCWVFWDVEEEEFIKFNNYNDIKDLPTHWQSKMLKLDLEHFKPWVDPKMLMGFL